MKQLDDEGLAPIPKCDRCQTRLAVWLVRANVGKGIGVGMARWKACTACAKLLDGKRSPLRSSDY